MNYIEYINKYLDKELDGADNAGFEEALITDEILQKALAQESAIRELFTYETIRRKALALHGCKKKEAELEKSIAEQFEYERIRKKTLTLHEKKKQKH
jgi:hypothetical protein